jgi:hypothetical protein
LEHKEIKSETFDLSDSSSPALRPSEKEMIKINPKILQNESSLKNTDV